MKRSILKLILEPFVENSVVHGLEPKMDRGHILLKGEELPDGMLLFTVQDDGVGVSSMEELEKGYGISNVRERIQLYYGKKSGVFFEEPEEGGLKVTIRIDPENKENRMEGNEG